MKRIYNLTLGLIATAGVISASAQQGNVGIGTSKPEESAALEIKANDKGFLIPRMSLTEMQAIKSPATGLMVYQTGESSGFYFYNGTKWAPLSETDAKSVATLDVNGWALDGNESANSVKAAATVNSFIGTPGGIPINFKIGGVRSGLIESTGNLKTTFGYEAGLNNTGIGSTAFGYRALRNTSSSNNNTAFGANSIRDITTGASNTAMGSSTLRSNTSGSSNAAFGTLTMLNNTTGSYNVAYGDNAMNKNISGNYNMAIGNAALYENTAGTQNMAIGVDALRNYTGSSNVGIGTGAGRGVLGSSTGSFNVFIGANAGATETGSNLLYISNSNTVNPLIKGDFAANNLKVNSKTTGYLAIGDFDTATSGTAGTGGLPLPANIGAVGGYRLVVQDGILCEKVKVALRATGSSDWADYVFEPEYKSKMMSLEDIEAFTIKNKHLPNVPSTEEVQKNGLDMQETSRMFMEKIEELTLYMIEMNKEIKALKEENAKLKK
jgi:trimeric autotransporter adhesin